MLLALALTLATTTPAAAAPADAPTAAATCGAPSFVFVGQPACVTLLFDGAHTQLENGCAVPLLIDQSVVRGGGAAQPVLPGASQTLHDLSAFSLGMEGEIYRATAVLIEADCAADPAPEPSRVTDAPAPAVAPASGLRGLLGAWLPAAWTAAW